MLALCPSLLHSPAGQADTPVLVFLCSPRMRTYQEMQQSGIFFSDIPLHDMSADYLLLAEQRKAEADLKEKYERLNLELKVSHITPSACQFMLLTFHCISRHISFLVLKLVCSSEQLVQSWYAH